MHANKRNKIIYRLSLKNPNPMTELKYNSNFELLIAGLLSAKSRDNIVNKVTNRLFQVANTPSSILSLGVEEIKKYIKLIGLFNNKAKNIINTCQLLIEKYNGKVPQNRSELESLPGIGRKTANMILGIAFNKPTIPVDTHVFRVANRTGFMNSNNVELMERKLLTIISKDMRIYFHHLFVLHGRYICTSRRPYCERCIIEDLCEYKKKRYL